MTFKFLDREDNLLALRADFTPAIARIVAAGALDGEMPHRIWYAGSVFRKTDWHRGRFHEFRQIGAELIGLNSMERDREILDLAFTCLDAVGLHDVQLHLNHAGIFRGIIGALGLAGDALQKVKTEIDRKDLRRMSSRLENLGVAAAVQSQLGAVCRCVGTEKLLRETRGEVLIEESCRAMDDLLALADGLRRWKDHILFDLTEIDELEYYTGMMFSFFSPRLKSELGKGGRYDALLQEFGRSLPAVGFSFSLDGLAELT
jgi:ATP phosphoribosyltransferase regulatory subunit